MARSLHQAISKKRGQQNPVALAVLLSFASTFASPGLLLADLSPEFEARLRGSGRVDAALIDRLIKTQDAAIDVIVVYRLSPPIAGREIGDEARGFERRAEIAERREHLLARLASEDFSLRRQFAGVPAMALAVSLEGILALSIDPTVRRIGLDIELEIQLAEAVPLVGLSALHSAGYEGGGIQVATVDTGIDAAHLDLADSLIDEQCFCSGGCCPAGGNTQSGPGAAADGHGHGTRVAGILTSNGMVAPVGGANDA